MNSILDGVLMGVHVQRLCDRCFIRQTDMKKKINRQFISLSTNTFLEFEIHAYLRVRLKYLFNWIQLKYDHINI